MHWRPTGLPHGLDAEEDRRERRRKLGLPEELTPEELEAQRAREAEAAAKKEAQRLKDILPVKPVSGAFRPHHSFICELVTGKISGILQSSRRSLPLSYPLYQEQPHLKSEAC